MIAAQAAGCSCFASCSVIQISTPLKSWIRSRLHALSYSLFRKEFCRQVSVLEFLHRQCDMVETDIFIDIGCHNFCRCNRLDHGSRAGSHSLLRQKPRIFSKPAFFSDMIRPRCTGTPASSKCWNSMSWPMATISVVQGMNWSSSPVGRTLASVFDLADHLWSDIKSLHMTIFIGHDA